MKSALLRELPFVPDTLNGVLEYWAGVKALLGFVPGVLVQIQVLVHLKFSAVWLSMYVERSIDAWKYLKYSVPRSIAAIQCEIGA